MRITRFVPAGKVPLTGATEGAAEVELETEADASGRITLSGLRCKIGRSGSESGSLLELVSALRRVGTLFESVLELPGALRRVGPLEYPPEFRLELSTDCR